ncbi:hypothetical protein GJAV_G00057410, partial [Gymnothorax javanicus]
MPPAVFRMVRKTVRTTVSDAMKAFIDLKPVGTNMVDYLQAAEQTRAYPYTLVLGGEECCLQAFTILSGQALEQDSVVQAVDVCFKSLCVQYQFSKTVFLCLAVPPRRLSME